MSVKLEFEVEVPGDHSDKDIEEWLRFELLDNGSCSGTNPLVSTPVEPVWGSFEWSKA